MVRPPGAFRKSAEAVPRRYTPPMPLIPSLRQALSRLLGAQTGVRDAPRPAAVSPPRGTATASVGPGQLIAVGDHVIFATSDREAERALLLIMEGASDELRRACGLALQRVRGRVGEAAA